MVASLRLLESRGAVPRRLLTTWSLALLIRATITRWRDDYEQSPGIAEPDAPAADRFGLTLNEGDGMKLLTPQRGHTDNGGGGAGRSPAQFNFTLTQERNTA